MVEAENQLPNAEDGCCCPQIMQNRPMTQQGASYQEYLLNLLSNELGYRIMNRKGKSLNTSGLPCGYDVSEFWIDEIDFPDGVDLQRLLKLDFYHFGKKSLSLWLNWDRKNNAFHPDRNVCSQSGSTHEILTDSRID